MQILIIILINLFILKCYSSNSSCLPCTSTLYRSCYNCFNKFSIEHIHVEKISIICNLTNNNNNNNNIFQEQEHFYSIIKSFTVKYCTMKIFYFDQYTLWNYLEYISITYAHLTRLSPVIFNRSLSISPILYSIKTLNLSHNSIRIIDTNFSYYFPSLEKLDLSYNRLILIRKKAFINLINLQELYLNNNYLKQILSIIFPRHSLNLINLNYNHWHCSCTNVLILSVSQPIPICQTPIQYKNQNAFNIARQCFFRSKAIILITTNIYKEQNLTCALSSTIDIWKNKTNQNITLLSAWHIEQRRPIAIEYLYALSKKFEKYLICFNLNSSQPESIYTIISLTSKSSLLNNKNLNTNLSMNITTNRTFIIVKSERKLPEFFLWLLNISKNILPKYFRTSDKLVLIVWLILLTIVLLILSFLIYFIYRQRQKFSNFQINSFSQQLIRYDKNSHKHRTIFNLKFNCKNHKCLCQYRRRAHSTMYLAKSTTSKSIILSNIESNNSIRPLLIKPTELRYAKIKRISSIKELNDDYLAGQFRTTVKLKSLPN
ncbi:unnamed protein product [Rotaria sordida]|uniref:Uncharacterized protein n=1 Tax=Rotaria sordida TaxID=392033 RepID=A0A814M7V2_9BILA|nr:unnamed protein product [Rotaria sordida]CAF3699470.1 unnamed protein product [Rotaria sordida]